MLASTVSRIIPIVAHKLGLDEKRDRAEIIEEIHECRSLMFSGLGKEVREAFFLGKRCVPVQEYSHDCRSRCRSNYLGFSLPVDVIKGEVFRSEGERIELSSEYSNPNTTRFGHCLTGVDLGTGWPLPVDPSDKFDLGFRIDAENCPEGLVVGVRYYDLNGAYVREDVELTNEITYASQSVSVLDKNGITLPPGREAIVEVYSGVDKIAEYHPSIDVPDYHRFAISGANGQEIEISDALSTVQRAIFDSDPVETGDPIFWRNMLQWKDLHYKTKRSTSEERAYASTYQILLTQAAQMLSIKEPDTFHVVVKPELPAFVSLQAYRNKGTRGRRRIFQ